MSSTYLLNRKVCDALRYRHSRTHEGNVNYAYWTMPSVDVFFPMFLLFLPRVYSSCTSGTHRLTLLPDSSSSGALPSLLYQVPTYLPRYCRVSGTASLAYHGSSSIHTICVFCNLLPQRLEPMVNNPRAYLLGPSRCFHSSSRIQRDLGMVTLQYQRT